MSLTKEQIKEAFNLFDADGSGAIDASEMGLVLKGLGFTECSERDVQNIVKAIDSDGSGTVEYQEFENMVIMRMDKADSPDEIWKAYSLFDPDKSGRISFEDLKRVAVMEDPSVGDDEIHRILNAVAEVPERVCWFYLFGKLLFSLFLFI